MVVVVAALVVVVVVEAAVVVVVVGVGVGVDLLSFGLPSTGRVGGETTWRQIKRK